MFININSYPKDRKMGWNAEVNGVCHDNANWFFSQDGNIWKFPKTHKLNSTCKSPDRMKNICKNEVGKHIGDIDHYKGYIFAPIAEKNKCYIKVFKASDLTFIKDIYIDRPDGKKYASLAWLAINPNNGLLYTSDAGIKNKYEERRTPLIAYKINFKDDISLKFHSEAYIYDESGNELERGYMQGGTFDNDNHLYTNNGAVTGSENYANSKGGVSVFKVSAQPKENECDKLHRIAHSSQDGKFIYIFQGSFDEPEGLTYWDLDKSIVPDENINGQLHVIKLVNGWSTRKVGITTLFDKDAWNDNKEDKFYFCHYERDFKALPENKKEMIDDGYSLYTDYAIDDKDILNYYNKHYGKIGEYGPPVSGLRTKGDIKYQNFKNGVIVKYPDGKVIGHTHFRYALNVSATVKQNGSIISGIVFPNSKSHDYTSFAIQGESEIIINPRIRLGIIDNNIFPITLNMENGWGYDKELPMKFGSKKANGNNIDYKGVICSKLKTVVDLSINNVIIENEYCMNKKSRSDGGHQVHRSYCSYLPSCKNMIELGVFPNDIVALEEAKKEANRLRYEKVDGCAKCCSDIDYRNMKK